MVYNPEKEPFKVIPNKMRPSHLPRRMFMPKAADKDKFEWSNLKEPAFCLPLVYELDLVFCPQFTCKELFIRPVTEAKDYFHKYPECRDKDMPAKPEKKSNPFEDFYIMNLFTNAAELEAKEYMIEIEDRINKAKFDKENANKPGVAYMII